jgi:putative ribosome biogenesis GTPase RsgA
MSQLERRLAQFVDRAEEMLGSDEKRIMIIHGKSGMGKSLRDIVGLKQEDPARTDEVKKG